MLDVAAWLASVAILATGAATHGRERNIGGVLLVGALALSFALSIVLAFMPPPRWYLAAPEFLAIALAVRIWHDYGQGKARVVALISMGKLGLRWGWSQGWIADHHVFAAALNAGFLIQCLVAGGMLDGIGVAITDRFRAFRRRLAGSSRHGVA